MPELAIELDDQPLANSEPDAFVFLERAEISPKNIFPMLHNMVRHGSLNVPVIGLAKSGWTIDQFWNRALFSCGRDASRGHGPSCSGSSGMHANACLRTGLVGANGS